MVWAIPVSLAATWGITIVFSSSGYLDVSVRRVSVFRQYIFNILGCPIRKSTTQRLFAPYRSLSQLITSFIASESQGIRRTPLVTFLTNVNKFYFIISFKMSKNFFLTIKDKVENIGVEPMTSCVQGRRSSQLS